SGCPDVVPEKLCERESGEQTCHAQDESERHLGKGVALEAAKELRAHLIPGGEEEEIEEDRLDDGRNLDVELPDQNPGQERPDDDPEAEAPELDTTDQEANRESEENRQLGIVPQRLYEKVHVGLLPV